MQQSTQAALRAMSIIDILISQLEKLHSGHITDQEIISQLQPFDQDELQTALNRVMVRNQSQERRDLIQILKQRNLLTQQMANFYQTFMEECQPVKVKLDEYLKGKNSNNYVTHVKLIKGAQKEHNFYLTFKDETAQTQCLFMLPLIQDQTLYDSYRKLKAQSIFEIRNALTYGEPPKLKIIKKSSITIVEEPPLDQMFELITKSQIKQEEEMDLVAIVKEIRPPGNLFKTVIFLTGSESGQMKQGCLNLWDQFKALELPVNSIFLVETVLIKQYNNTYELNTTKTQTKFHTKRESVPQELLQYWDKMKNLRDYQQPKSPLRQIKPVQIQVQNSGSKQVVQNLGIGLDEIFQSTDDKIFDVMAYVRFIGEPQLVKGNNFETTKVSLSIEDHSRKAQIFLWDAFANMDFILNKVYFFQGVQYKARYQELKTTRSTQIMVEDKIVSQDLIQRITNFKKSFLVAQSTQKKMAGSQRKIIEGQKVLTLVEGLKLIQDGDQNQKQHTFATKAQIIDLQVYDLKHICSSCSSVQIPTFFRQKSRCPQCQAEDLIEFNIGGIISDHTTHLQITLQDSCLSIIPHNPDLTQIKHYEMYFKEFLMFKSFWMKCRYNPHKQPSFRFALSDLEEVNELDLIALLLN